MVRIYLYYLQISYWNTFVNNSSLLIYAIKVKPSGTSKGKKPEMKASESQNKSLSEGRVFNNYKNEAKILKAER